MSEKKKYQCPICGIWYIEVAKHLKFSHKLVGKSPEQSILTKLSSGTLSLPPNTPCPLCGKTPCRTAKLWFE